jgi:heme-degrading monooxygenase HmoA
MFLLNEILNFGPGRREEALARLQYIHGLMASKAGFQRAIVARYLGSPTRHTILRVWDDEAAFRAFREGPDGNYGRGRPEGLYSNEPVVPQWNGYAAAAGSARGGYLVKVQNQAPENAKDAYRQYQTQLNKMAQDLGGLVSSWQFQAKEGDGFLTVWRFAGVADFDRMFEDPQRVQARAGLPEGISPSSIECFDVVSEVLPA